MTNKSIRNMNWTTGQKELEQKAKPMNDEELIAIYREMIRVELSLKQAGLPYSQSVIDKTKDKIAKLQCACLEHIGDNPSCPIVNHYDPRTEEEKWMDEEWKDQQDTIADLIAGTH